MTDISTYVDGEQLQALYPHKGISHQNSRKVVIDNIQFDSQIEGQRYLELKLLERAGDIQHLEAHKKELQFIIQGRCRDRWTKEVIRQRVYTADFKYYDMAKGRWIVEDVKGKRKTKKGNIVPKVSRDFYLRWDAVRIRYPDIEFRIEMR